MRSDTDITAAQKTPTRRPARLRNRLPRLRACAGPRPATSPAPGLAADSGIASPRTPGHLEKSVKYPTSATPVDPRLPKITLQSPSLHQESSPAPAGLVSPLRSLHQPLPHQIHTARSPTARRSAVFIVAQVQDAALRKFFHDIADQLQLIGNASPRSSPAMESSMQSPALSQGESTAPPTPLPTPTEIEAPKPPIIARPMPSRAATDQPTSKHRPETTKRRS